MGFFSSGGEAEGARASRGCDLRHLPREEGRPLSSYIAYFFTTFSAHVVDALKDSNAPSHQ